MMEIFDFQEVLPFLYKNIYKDLTRIIERVL